MRYFFGQVDELPVLFFWLNHSYGSGKINENFLKSTNILSPIEMMCGKAQSNTTIAISNRNVL